MKVFILHKKVIIICLLFLTLFFIIFLSFYNPFSLAIEFSQNSFLNDALKNKFASLLKEQEKIIYLTFDDGPTPSATPKILDILKEEDIKATFFVIGKHVSEYPELVKREYEDGHYIGNHGYNHNNSKLYKDTESFKDEVTKTDEAIGNAIGIENFCSHIFRFPNGFMSSNYRTKKDEAVKILQEMDYIYIDWNCVNNDSIKKVSSQQLLDNLKKTSKNKGTLVVLMHDTTDVNDSSKILKEAIHYFKSQGYEFKNFYDL